MESGSLAGMHNATRIIIMDGEPCLLDDVTYEVYAVDGTFRGLQGDDGRVQADVAW